MKVRNEVYMLHVCLHSGLRKFVSCLVYDWPFFIIPLPARDHRRDHGDLGNQARGWLAYDG